MKKIILKATVLAAAMMWASTSFAGSAFNLYIDVKNIGAGDKVRWKEDNGSFVDAVQTASSAESSSWTINFTGGQPFPVASGTFSHPISFRDETRLGYFDIVKFTDSTHLTLDVRQAVSQGNNTTQSSYSSSTNGDAYFVKLTSTGTLYTNTAPVPEPSSYALIIGGLLAVGFVAKRSKTKRV